MEDTMTLDVGHMTATELVTEWRKAEDTVCQLTKNAETLMTAGVAAIFFTKQLTDCQANMNAIQTQVGLRQVLHTTPGTADKLMTLASGAANVASGGCAIANESPYWAVLTFVATIGLFYFGNRAVRAMAAEETDQATLKLIQQEAGKVKALTPAINVFKALETLPTSIKQAEARFQLRVTLPNDMQQRISEDVFNAYVIKSDTSGLTRNIIEGRDAIPSGASHPVLYALYQNQQPAGQHLPGINAPAVQAADDPEALMHEGVGGRVGASSPFSGLHQRAGGGEDTDSD